ncbi:MAG: hypothetical protein N3E52_04650 [Candidatus Bathyarchaeota archaeon]|nr:hypothetical protein [Candidatus Bathyarchaeota archaeon]
MSKKRSNVGYLLAVIILAILITSVMVLTYLQTKSQVRVPGVAIGDTFVYDVMGFWNVSAVNSTIPQRMLDINQTKEFRVTITNITGPMVSTRETWVFKNGTEYNSTSMINVETGYNTGGFWPIVAANLGKGELLHPSGQNKIAVNETVIRNYASGPRETNYFKIKYNGRDEEYGYYTAEAEYYFDKATGMLVELYDRSDFISMGTQGAILWKLKATSVWKVS